MYMSQPEKDQAPEERSAGTSVSSSGPAATSSGSSSSSSKESAASCSTLDEAAPLKTENNAVNLVKGVGEASATSSPSLSAAGTGAGQLPKPDVGHAHEVDAQPEASDEPLQEKENGANDDATSMVTCHSKSPHLGAASGGAVCPRSGTPEVAPCSTSFAARALATSTPDDKVTKPDACATLQDTSQVGVASLEGGPSVAPVSSAEAAPQGSSEVAVQGVNEVTKNSCSTTPAQEIQLREPIPLEGDEAQDTIMNNNKIIQNKVGGGGGGKTAISISTSSESKPPHLPLAKRRPLLQRSGHEIAFSWNGASATAISGCERLSDSVSDRILGGTSDSSNVSVSVSSSGSGSARPRPPCSSRSKKVPDAVHNNRPTSSTTKLQDGVKTKPTASLSSTNGPSTSSTSTTSNAQQRSNSNHQRMKQNDLASSQLFPLLQAEPLRVSWRNKYDGGKTTLEIDPRTSPWFREILKLHQDHRLLLAAGRPSTSITSSEKMTPHCSKAAALGPSRSANRRKNGATRSRPGEGAAPSRGGSSTCIKSNDKQRNQHHRHFQTTAHHPRKRERPSASEAGNSSSSSCKRNAAIFKNSNTSTCTSNMPTAAAGAGAAGDELDGMDEKRRYRTRSRQRRRNIQMATAAAASSSSTFAGNVGETAEPPLTFPRDLPPAATARERRHAEWTQKRALVKQVDSSANNKSTTSSSTLRKYAQQNHVEAPESRGEGWTKSPEKVKLASGGESSSTTAVDSVKTNDADVQGQTALVKADKNGASASTDKTLEEKNIDPDLAKAIASSANVHASTGAANSSSASTSSVSSSRRTIVASGTGVGARASHGPAPASSSVAGPPTTGVSNGPSFLLADGMDSTVQTLFHAKRTLENKLEAAEKAIEKLKLGKEDEHRARLRCEIELESRQGTIISLENSAKRLEAEIERREENALVLRNRELQQTVNCLEAENKTILAERDRCAEQLNEGSIARNLQLVQNLGGDVQIPPPSSGSSTGFGAFRSPSATAAQHLHHVAKSPSPMSKLKKQVLNPVSEQVCTTNDGVLVAYHQQGAAEKRRGASSSFFSKLTANLASASTDSLAETRGQELGGQAEDGSSMLVHYTQSTKQNESTSSKRLKLDLKHPMHAGGAVSSEHTLVAAGSFSSRSSPSATPSASPKGLLGSLSNPASLFRPGARRRGDRNLAAAASTNLLSRFGSTSR
ncbi:unnamed protein product [Amoebophrya sp. A25]|nr:unnamed protein product [Amoebophrya sp. A25]|eukprot:GSA25T00011558001.1